LALTMQFDTRMQMGDAQEASAHQTH